MPDGAEAVRPVFCHAEQVPEGAGVYGGAGQGWRGGGEAADACGHAVSSDAGA